MQTDDTKGKYKTRKAGFENQTYTQVPNSLFLIMKDMDECELKVVLYICRYTFGYHREEVKISTRKLADAIEKAEKVYTSFWVADAINLAKNNGARHWNYCEKVLERWKREGRAEKKVPAAIDRNKYVTGAYADFVES